MFKTIPVVATIETYKEYLTTCSNEKVLHEIELQRSKGNDAFSLAALQEYKRREWNTAADVVVNMILSEAGIQEEPMTIYVIQKLKNGEPCGWLIGPRGPVTFNTMKAAEKKAAQLNHLDQAITHRAEAVRD